MLHLSLSRLEARLDRRRFVRVHRTQIVNLEQVRAFKPDARGNLEAEFLDGARVQVSRAGAEAQEPGTVARAAPDIPNANGRRRAGVTSYR